MEPTPEKNLTPKQAADVRLAEDMNRLAAAVGKVKVYAWLLLFVAAIAAGANMWSAYSSYRSAYFAEESLRLDREASRAVAPARPAP